MSTNTGLGADERDASAVLMKVKGTVTTSSPGPMPRARRAISSESVPEATLRQCRTPTYAASAASSSPISGPMMKRPWSRTRWIRSSISVL